MLRRIACFAGALLLFGCSSSGSSSSASRLQVLATIDTLPNGLHLIVHEDHSAPIVAVNIWYHVGSANEKPGRTGFAHLFEHLMFMGSQNAEYPQFDRLLEAAGGDNNASTAEDRTNYFESGPVTALPLMLWLEADRMGWLLPTMDLKKLNGQREIVKNERRQSYENQPYGLVADVMPVLMYPKGHPYSWPVIGSMADLSAASVEDVSNFFRTYYAPNNAVMVVAGDVKRDSVLALVKQYFADVPRGPAIELVTPSQPTRAADTVVVLEDNVQVPRLYYAWPSTAAWSPDDAPLQVAASILTGPKNARLTQRLIYKDQSVSGVSASPDHRKLAGEFDITATAKPGQGLPGIQKAIDEELQSLADSGPTARELQQAKNSIEADFLRSIQTASEKADLLNSYYFDIGKPDGFQQDLDRQLAVTGDDVKRVVKKYLLGPRAIVSVVPRGKKHDTAMAAGPRVTR